MKNKAVVDSKMVREENPDPMEPRSLQLGNRPRYEYKSVVLARTADLSPYGDEGWELRSTEPAPADQTVYHFIRRKL
jgi:hypothetical protein